VGKRLSWLQGTHGDTSTEQHQRYLKEEQAGSKYPGALRIISSIPQEHQAARRSLQQACASAQGFACYLFVVEMKNFATDDLIVFVAFPRN